MPRFARFNSECMHVIVRGVAKQILFEDDNDREKYLNILQKSGDETETIIVAYCLMENHVHMLLKNDSGNFSIFMKK